MLGPAHRVLLFPLCVSPAVHALEMVSQGAGRRAQGPSEATSLLDGKCSPFPPTHAPGVNTCTHTHMHTHICPRVQTHTRTHMCTHKHTHARTHKHTHAYMHMHTSVHTCTQFI